MNTTNTETAVQVSTELLTDTLTAMHWAISPYTDVDTAIRDDYPWIFELAIIYNKLVDNLNNSPEPIQHDFVCSKYEPRAIRVTLADFCKACKFGMFGIHYLLSLYKIVKDFELY